MFNALALLATLFCMNAHLSAQSANLKALPEKTETRLRELSGQSVFGFHFR